MPSSSSSRIGGSDSRRLDASIARSRSGKSSASFSISKTVAMCEGYLPKVKRSKVEKPAPRPTNALSASAFEPIMKRINGVYESRKLAPIIKLRYRTLVSFTYRSNSKFRHQVIVQHLYRAL